MAGIGDLTFEMNLAIWDFVTEGQVLVAVIENEQETFRDEWEDASFSMVFRSLTETSRLWATALIYTDFFRDQRIYYWGSTYMQVAVRQDSVNIGDFFEGGRVHWPLMFREWSTYQEDLEEAREEEERV